MHLLSNQNLISPRFAGGISRDRVLAIFGGMPSFEPISKEALIVSRFQISSPINFSLAAQGRGCPLISRAIPRRFGPVGWQRGDKLKHIGHKNAATSLKVAALAR